MDKAFINGDIYMEKFINEQPVMSPKPFLKALFIEEFIE
jgi:hypothetical protein